MSVTRYLFTCLLFGILFQRVAAEKCETSLESASVKCHGFKSRYKYAPSGSYINKVTFTENQFPLIDQTFFVEFPDTKIAILRGNGIENIASLSGLENVEVVDLSDNMITHLSRSAFRDNTKLKNVILRHNRLQDLASDTFEDLKELEALDLSRNQITQLNHAVFQHNIGLRTLVISHNNLKFMEADLLVNLQELQVFDASFNVLETVDTTMFLKCLQLKMINLNSNKLKSVDINFTHKLVHLGNFNLSSNSISEIIYDYFTTSKSSDVPITVSRDTNLGESDKEDIKYPTMQSLVARSSEVSDQIREKQQNPTTKSSIAQSSVTEGQQKNYVEPVRKENDNHTDLQNDKTRNEVEHDPYEENKAKNLSSFSSTTSSTVEFRSNQFFEYALFTVLFIIILLLVFYIIYPKLINQKSLNSNKNISETELMRRISIDNDEMMDFSTKDFGYEIPRIVRDTQYLEILSGSQNPFVNGAMQQGSKYEYIPHTQRSSILPRQHSFSRPTYASPRQGETVYEEIS